MSKTLDELVGPNYNKRIIPNYKGKPVEVELNLSVNGMVSVILFGFKILLIVFLIIKTKYTSM